MYMLQIILSLLKSTSNASHSSFAFMGNIYFSSAVANLIIYPKRPRETSLLSVEIDVT